MSIDLNCALALIGGAQRTLRAERELLLRDLCEKEFEALVYLGDMVEEGSAERAWQEFDRTFAPLFARGARFIPLLGNHDYWGRARQRRTHLRALFGVARGSFSRPRLGVH